MENFTLAITKPPEAKFLEIKVLEICQNGVLNIIVGITWLLGRTPKPPEAKILEIKA